ncbi:post-GPI attachment to proteins factor 6 [Orussus abietinus]|uniref:post-GPI attachment to proteins factor 6 n=1 Tax=Orussus abietinus TaxID=222816 RepID=UPI000625BA32|nr:post-GPI attachment to proteins factor 6 [Orussus abietinus]
MPKNEVAFLLTCSLVIHHGLCGEFVKVAQQPSNLLVDYYAYRHISIVHFTVPENSVTAVFTFTAKEEKTGGIGSCKPRDVSVYLKSGSLPLIIPDKSKIFAKLLKRRREYRSLKMSSDEQKHLVSIQAPAPGDWYAIGFRSWSDPNEGKITQQGLGASCDTILDVDLEVELADSVLTYDGEHPRILELNDTSNTAVVRFFVPLTYNEPVMNLNSTCGELCNVDVIITTSEHLTNGSINTTDALIPFKPHTKVPHFLNLRLRSGNATSISVSLTENLAENATEINPIVLMRKSLPDFFLFDYEYREGNDTKTSPLNLTLGTLSVLRFDVGAVYDVGGTVSVGLKLDNGEAKDDKNLVVVGCVSLGTYVGITATGGCLGTNMVSPPDVFANGTGPAFVHIPYPEPGTWHLSLKAFSTGKNCSCTKGCLTNGCKICDCLEERSARVETNVASSPCIEGRCKNRGRCVHYMSGGFVFSACHCTGGYRGFDCADDKYVLTRTDVLVSLVLLTCSNLAFAGSIYVAVRRRYYTEAVVYAAVMVFSTLYHACESGEEVYHLCVTRLPVLQFCDFFNALLSIWLTLVAMASLGPKISSFCQITGAVVLAMGAELDRTSLWVFLTPTVTGCTLVAVSWGLRCKRKGTFRYPATPYRSILLPAGLVLVSLGLVSYAFLQTRQNYYIVHSLWHVCVAVGVMLLLPKREYMK